jgi:glucuronokinase
LTATARAYARAALVGNPSDGYGGRTIAYTFRDLCADVAVRTARRLTIDAKRGEAALLEAAHGRFAAYCAEHGGEAAPCMLSVRSTIPPEVGLAGSSAIVVATLRALGSFNSVQIPKAVLPTVALAAEEDLGIPAGLQDRVAQVYEGLVYMDFDPEHLALRGHGRYERLDSNLLEHAYVAWSPRAKVSSATFHGELRRRFRSGDADVIAALGELGELVNAARTCLRGGDSAGLDAIINANFDLRRRLGPLDPTHVRMVEVARAAGASANYAGSGGSITGLVVGANRFAELKCALAGLGCTVIRPTIVG